MSTRAQASDGPWGTGSKGGRVAIHTNTLEILMKLRLPSALTTALVVAPLLALGTSATAATAATAGAPGADRAGASVRHPSVRRVHDARGDVLRVAERRGKDVFTPAPARRHGDISAFKVAHRDAAVVGTVKVRRLTHHDRFFGAVLELRTGRATYTAVVYRQGVGQRLKTQFDGGGRDSCAGLRYDLDYGHDTVTISVPRTCLGDPAWVRSRAVIDYFGRQGASGAFFADAAPGTELTRIPFLAKAWHPGD